MCETDLLMSLLELGVFPPIREGHPVIGDRCWSCDGIFAAGVRTGFKPFKTPEETRPLTLMGKVVCATCVLRGMKIMTPAGPRIVHRIKDGDASPYPVETTDGKQWKDDEVMCYG